MRDDELRLIFTCCHPSLSEAAQVALTRRAGRVYLICTEGHTATQGDALIRGELCMEAIRLGRLLAELMVEEPEVLGLLALMLLTESRRAARSFLERQRGGINASSSHP